jgi:hypothetical protein
MLVGLSDTTAVVPVPIREAVAPAVPTIANVVDRTPEPDGVKVRFTVQDELAAMVPPFAQLPVPALAKSEAFPPEMLK